MKNCAAIISQYHEVLEVYQVVRSMKAAFEDLDLDREAVAKTSVIAELFIAAPEAYEAIGEWNENIEKLSAYVKKCREAITPEIRAKINQLKDSGHLLPLA